MIKRSGVDRYRHLRGVRGEVEVIGKFGTPIAKAMRRIGETLDIAVGTPAQRFLGRRRPILKLLQLRDLVEKIGEVAVLGSRDLISIVDVGADGGTEHQPHTQRNSQKKPATP